MKITTETSRKHTSTLCTSRDVIYREIPISNLGEGLVRLSTRQYHTVGLRTYDYVRVCGMRTLPYRVLFIRVSQTLSLSLSLSLSSQSSLPPPTIKREALAEKLLLPPPNRMAMMMMCWKGYKVMSTMPLHVLHCVYKLCRMIGTRERLCTTSVLERYL